MTALDLNVAQGDLIGAGDSRLASRFVGDFEPVFTGPWHSDAPRPRFGDQVWEIAGMDPLSARRTWTIDFSEMSPEWSLLSREAIYIRANARKFRHAITFEWRSKEHLFKAGTIQHWRDALRNLEEMADELGIGLPATWRDYDVRKLRALVMERYAAVRYGGLVSNLYRMRTVLSLGGLRFDPTRDIGIAEWAGDTSSRRTLASRGIEPDTFRAVVGDALTYVEQCAPDILNAVNWLNAWTPQTARRAPLTADHPARLAHPDVIGHRRIQMQQVIDRVGGIPAATVPSRNGSGADVGRPCLATLCYAAEVRHDNPRDRTWVMGRIESGTPVVPGGLPLTVSTVTRADGSVGPWRDPFCAKSVAVEAQTLQAACKIVLMAFTAMRDSELNGVPRTGWRTTWHGADAITTPLVKNGHGEPLKWWATPPVLRACEVLQELADPTWEFLLTPVRIHNESREATTRREAKNWLAVQNFVRRMNTDPHLKGFLAINAGWGTTTLKNRRSDDDLPLLHPRAFRFTLASISNFVALGDVAFQQQAKHAALTMTHSYAANGATSTWAETVLNTLTNRDAEERVAKAADLYQKEWAGEQHLAGHAGRDLTRTIRQLLDRLPIDEYDPDADEPEAEQFTVQVMRLPELVAAIKATAQMLYPGTINHCLRYAPQMECTDKAEPMQGLCRPQTCRNVLLEQDQQDVFRHRLDQVTEWLGMPRVPAAQKAVLERSRQHLEAQLRTEDPT